MSGTGGITEQVFGLDLLTEHNMKPWWETIHGYLLAITITASGLIVYFTASGQQVDCLPISENASMLSESQVNLMNGYCTGEVPWYIVYAGILNFITSSLILLASNVWLKHPDVIDGFRTFIKAANIISGLHSRSKQLNQLAVTPVFHEEGEAFELRKACLLLWSHPNKIQWQYRFRNALVIALTLFALGATLIVSALMTSLVVYPHFNCSLSEELQDELHVALNGLKIYFCSYNYAAVTFPFMILSGAAFVGQLLALGIASIKLRPPKISALERNTFSDAFIQAKAYAHFMEVFWMNASPVDSQRFGGLLEYIFSREAVSSMVRFLPMAVTNVEATKDENQYPPPNRASKHRYVLTPNPDLTYVEMYVHMHRYGGNNALFKLYKIFEGRKFAENYQDINEALSKVKFSIWDNDAKHFVEAAGDRKYWDLLVNILNSYDGSNSKRPHARKLKCDYYNFDFEDLQGTGESARNVLYYALRKEEGELDFSLVAIKHILACTKGKSMFTVYGGAVVMSAEEYVLTQFEQDPTFTEELKLELVTMIKQAQNPDFKFSTVKL